MQTFVKKKLGLCIIDGIQSININNVKCTGTLLIGSLVLLKMKIYLHHFGHMRKYGELIAWYAQIYCSFYQNSILLLNCADDVCDAQKYD